MDEIVKFRVSGWTIPMDQPAANIFAFCCLMSAVAANRKGGANGDHLAECADFMSEVVGRRLSVADPLPDDFDWSPRSAIGCAYAMMEHDGD